MMIIIITIIIIIIIIIIIYYYYGYICIYIYPDYHTIRISEQGVV